MDKREYLRSLGFDVGKRGRFSAEMLEALKNFEEEPEEEPEEKLHSVPKRTDVPKYWEAVTEFGQVIRFDTCPACKESISYCYCKNPRPPKWLASEVASWTTGR